MTRMAIEISMISRQGHGSLLMTAPQWTQDVALSVYQRNLKDEILVMQA